MTPTRVMVSSVLVGLCCVGVASGADPVLDWNSTIRSVIQSDGMHVVNHANPGWSTRAMAMMNGAIYDTFQAFDRTHEPFFVDTVALPNVSRDAAIHEAAYQILRACYADESPILDAHYAARMALIANGSDKSAGMTLGSQVAQAYIAARSGDHSADNVVYVPGSSPGEWRPDPYHPEKPVWGPGWGTVDPFAIPATNPFVSVLPTLPLLQSQIYSDAFNQVKSYGSVDSAVRTDDQKEMGLFWAYDRPTMGPPPVLFVRNLTEIASQANNTPEENSRLFAMASVAMADAAIAAWDAKFTYNFWRPVTAIQEADTDGNSYTEPDLNWRPLGAPGDDPGNFTDDFTPPFPAWTSGHATMGGALFKTIELFFGTNSFDAIDGIQGNDTTYTLTSQEFGISGQIGMSRDYSSFTQAGPLDIGLENSPEGENGTSRIYLGIHWIFDQRDGISLGNSIAGYVATNRFQAVPEPMTLDLAVLITGVWVRRRTLPGSLHWVRWSPNIGPPQ